MYEAVQLALSYFPRNNKLFVQVILGSPIASHVLFCGSDKPHDFNSVTKSYSLHCFAENYDFAQRGLTS